jgi:hypothetical protein
MGPAVRARRGFCFVGTVSVDLECKHFDQTKLAFPSIDDGSIFGKFPNVFAIQSVELDTTD